MIKRLFLISGVLAFVATCAVMWFWFLPQQEHIQQMEENSVATDSISPVSSDTLNY